MDQIDPCSAHEEIVLVFSVPLFLGRCKEDTFWNPAGRKPVFTQDFGLVLIGFHMVIISPRSHQGTPK